MATGEFVLAPRLDARLDPGWKDAVAELAGVRVIGRDGAGMRIAAPHEAVAQLRDRFADALRIEPVLERGP